MTRYKSRRRQVEGWLGRRKEQLQGHWMDLQEQLMPASWAVRCQRVRQIPEGNPSRWMPRAGSSSAELSMLLSDLPLIQRQLLASLLDAPAAGVLSLVEAVERLQLDWRQRLDPLRSHRDYAAQLETLALLLKLPAAARSAYLENERRIFPAIDILLFESLPMGLRADMANQHVAGEGGCLRWWRQRLLARSGVPGYDLAGLGEADWPGMPAAWFALGWICSLRQAGTNSGAPGNQGGA
ncbi:MAG: hypothetical protein WC953_14490 [Pseudomonas sp.]